MKNDSWFLVVGCGRGGTSLLTALLDAHSSMSVFSEMCSVAFLMGAEIESDGLDIFHQRVSRFVSECETEAKRVPNEIWGNKITTEQIFALEDHNKANPENMIDVFDIFFNKYLHGVKIVFILRDGRTCVRSKIARTGQSVELACERWNYSIDMCRFLQVNHDNNIVIKFEDLLASPNETLGDVCDFLGVSYELSMLDGVQSKVLLPEYRNSKLDISKTSLHDIPDGCIERIEGNLRDYGYLGS